MIVKVTRTLAMTDIPRPPLTKEQFASVKSFAENSTSSLPGDMRELLLILLATIEAKDRRLEELEGAMRNPTSEMIGAAWATWRIRHEAKIGPGPAFRKAIQAACASITGELRP